MPPILKSRPRFNRALHRLARPWYRIRALKVYRDETNLSAAEELWPRMVRALDDSTAFILLASGEAAGSKWVRDGVEKDRIIGEDIEPGTGTVRT